MCGGGRYDNLSEAIGGPRLPGVGFACGLDRIVLVMEQQGCTFGRRPQARAYVAALDGASRGAAQVLAHELRRAGVAAEQDTADRSFKAQMKNAGASGARWACILGPEELAKGCAAVRDLEEGSQTEVPLAQVPDYIQSRE